uniref:Uncharacterized protein n=1 Tax=Cucumis melo TaxID=3656 RepID=A0A9I9EAX7_CUCME
MREREGRWNFATVEIEEREEEEMKDGRGLDARRGDERDRGKGWRRLLMG